MYFILCPQRSLGPQIANSQITNLRNVRKSNKLFKSANLLPICDIRYLFADRPPVKNTVRGQQIKVYEVFLVHSFWAQIYILKYPIPVGSTP